MLDQVPMARPRVALVYGDADAAGHLRAAVAGHVQIVYATAAAEFDPVRLADSRASAALLNLDSCEWLDSVESCLHAAGVAVVYNDPEISRALQGWEQARWLRHLTAKLSGSTDYDPPRPAPAADPATAPVPATGGAQPATPPEPASADVAAPAEVPADVAEQPLSLAEIASMTVNFKALPEPAPEPGSNPAVAEAGAMDSGEPVAAAFEAAPEAVVAEPAGDGPLDVDTEALSALIDARLAQADDHATSDAPQVWRVAHGGAVSAVDLAPATESAPEPPGQGAHGAIAAPVEDAELMQGLPAIDDWQLVDRDAPAVPAQAAASGARGEPSVTIDFAGLELVPMEPVAQVELHTEPIERWMHVNDDKHAADKHKRADANGEQA